MAIKRAKSSFVAYIGGVPRIVHEGDLIDETDPVVKGRESLFGDIADHVAGTRPPVEQATARPGERRSVRPGPGRGGRRREEG
ncbi:hypothetical protein ACLQ2E_21880 [Streptomyces lavendulocolor]